MLRLVVTIDKPTSEKVVRRRSYLTDIAGNPGGGVSHGWHFQFRHSLHALKGKRRRKTDLISITDYFRFAPKASRRPSQSFTTNSRECQGVFARPRVNSTPRVANSAKSASASSMNR